MSFTRTVHPTWRLAATLAAAATLAGSLAGCEALVVGGAVIGSGLFVTDRRTSGAQVEDESIEFKAGGRVRNLATLGQVSVTSYNRTVLLTGQVPGEAEKAQVEKAVAGIENVRGVVNELEVGSNASLSSRSSDTLLSAKIKATLVDAKDLQANSFKLVVERGVVYMMGRVTEREAARGTELARSVSGTQKVVRVFEILTEDELARLGNTSAPAAAPASKVAPAPSTAAPAAPAPAASATQ